MMVEFFFAYMLCCGVKEVLHREKDICQRNLVDFPILLLNDYSRNRKGVDTMTIGSKIQKARIAAGLIQEQAAERLQVSRQTISNWENDRTLPDVAFAKDIGRVYGVSLDEMISGTPIAGNPMKMPERIDNNEELGKACLGMYFFLWIGCFLFFWFLGHVGGFAMFYAIFIYGILYHAGTAVIAFLFGLFDCWPVKRYFLVFLFGFGQMLLPWLTYDLRNTIFNSGRINPLSWEAFVTGICISAVCITMGSLINWFVNFLQKLLNKRIEG